MDGRRPRTWGARLSWRDVLVLVVGSAATWWLQPRIGPAAGVIPMAIGHFLLFCNIFRIHRTKEILWAVTCVINISAWGLFDDLWWPGILLVQTPLTVAAIIWEMRGPWYHGIFARRLNRRLDEYLENRL